MTKIEHKSRIYKYCTINKNTIIALTKGMNWISDPSFFNDPFEFSLPSDCFFCEETETLKHITEQESINKDTIRSLGQQFGVVCYSQNNDNMLMWSHYADNHRGICLGFEPTVPFNQSHVGMVFSYLNRVQYCKMVPPYQFGGFETKEIIDVFCTKSSDWEYEEEIRQIFDKKSQYVEYPGILKEIIFGCKTPKEDIQLIASIMSGKGIEFWFSEKHDGQYSLVIGSGLHYEIKYGLETKETQTT